MPERSKTEVCTKDFILSIKKLEIKCTRCECSVVVPLENVSRISRQHRELLCAYCGHTLLVPVKEGAPTIEDVAGRLVDLQKILKMADERGEPDVKFITEGAE